MKVLVIEDENLGIRALLRELGHEVLEASREGLQLVSTQELVRSLPAPKRTQAFIAAKNSWRTDRRARGRKA